ncbi:type IVB secretion system protein IcmW [Marinobacterium jannaschii]|uniref:type IVB secretion system protein IcmW n=1 Tax=Marinobacterium jannaschii TaxID=64970 RepID=UPI000480A16D|nr:hypothetical protein [Marinobacterium jannaschii]
MQNPRGHTDDYWQQFGAETSALVRRMTEFEDWTKGDDTEQIAEAIRVFLASSNGMLDTLDDDQMITAMALLAFLPADRALIHMMNLYEKDINLFDSMLRIVNDNPPLLAYAKVMQGRLITLHRHRVLSEVFSPENFAAAKMALAVATKRMQRVGGAA